MSPELQPGMHQRSPPVQALARDALPGDFRLPPSRSELEHGNAVSSTALPDSEKAPDSPPRVTVRNRTLRPRKLGERVSSMNSVASQTTTDEQSPTSDVVAKENLVLDLRSGDYSGGYIWFNRGSARLADAHVPDGVRFDNVEKAFIFPGGGDVITVPLATNPWAMQDASYAAWVKVLEPLREGQLGWFLGQCPDYGWSRALTLNDFRLGYVSITTSTYWNSKLGRAPVGSWLHIVGVWTQGGECAVYLNGDRGASAYCNNGTGSEPAEQLVIGGRSARDPVHNPHVAVADISVYNKALTHEEVRQLYSHGRSSKDADAASENSEGLPGAKKKAPYVDAPPSSPVWDEEERLFWFPTGVNAYDLPDGTDWQRQFKEALENSKPPEERRTLQRNSSAASPPPSPMPPRGRRLANNPSDPDKMARKILHSTALRQMPQKSGFALRVQDQRIALFRFENRVFAVDAECPHQGASLIEGEIGDIEDMVEGRRFHVTCPVHKFQFDLVTGTVLQGKCPKLPIYKVRMREAEGEVDDERKFAMVEVGFESLSAEFFVEFDCDDF